MKIVRLVLVSYIILPVLNIIGIENCTWLNCKPPDCRCSDWGTPGNLSVADTPQFVFLTFDNHFNSTSFNVIKEILHEFPANHEKCRVPMTFFVSHLGTDYALVNELYNTGHEIAVHSITHPHMKAYTYQQISDEIVGQRSIIEKFARIPKSALQGIRMPYLELVGNYEYQVLRDAGFTYDFSRVEWTHPTVWPYTLDYISSEVCINQSCPTNSFPGIWTLPMLAWVDYNGHKCKMLDDYECAKPLDIYRLYKFMLKQFYRVYSTGKAPFGIYIHPYFFDQKYGGKKAIKAYVKFVKHIRALKDVIIVSNAHFLLNSS